jgi:hypothetical protein
MKTKIIKFKSTEKLSVIKIIINMYVLLSTNINLLYKIINDVNWVVLMWYLQHHI